jgi:transposase InsO family protein
LFCNRLSGNGQTDFPIYKVIGWRWFRLSTILGDFSHHIITWKLCTTMKASDVNDMLEPALEAFGCSDATVARKPRLLSGNGSSCAAADLAKCREDKGMDHLRDAARTGCRSNTRSAICGSAAPDRSTAARVAMGTRQVPANAAQVNKAIN